jgi:hypothetical protein
LTGEEGEEDMDKDLCWRIVPVFLSLVINFIICNVCFPIEFLVKSVWYLGLTLKTCLVETHVHAFIEIPNFECVMLGVSEYVNSCFSKYFLFRKTYK